MAGKVKHDTKFFNRASRIMKKDGVTLIELIIVLAIIGIVAALATISVSWFMRETRVSESRDRLLADIEDVKLKSLAGIPHGIIITGGNNTSYRLVSLTDAAGADFKRDTPADDGSIVDLAGSPVTLQTNYRITLTGSDELWFDRKGIPRTANWGVLNRTFTIWYDDNGNGSVDAGEANKTISVDNGGRIQYEQ